MDMIKDHWFVPCRPQEPARDTEYELKALALSFHHGQVKR